MSSFVKVTVVPNQQGAAGYEPALFHLNTNSIIAIRARGQSTYLLVVSHETREFIRLAYFGQNTTVKEITAEFKDIKSLIE